MFEMFRYRALGMAAIEVAGGTQVPAGGGTQIQREARLGDDAGDGGARELRPARYRWLSW
jgi:hypothetical protein